jgi:Phage portal protein
MSEPVRRSLPPSVFARLADAACYVITGVSPDTWFGPLQPLAPMAPPEVKGRRWDYPFGANLNYIPRSDDGVSFGELRALADALPLLRSVIETRKDQIAAQSYAIRARDRSDSPASSQAIDTVTRFLARPDRRHSFADWLRMLLEDMLVIDAATLYPRYNRGGSLYALDVIDGATIKPLIGEDGRAPEPPDPAYQQILKGIPAADFSAEELLYLPRNVRAHRLYGMSPVEQIALTVNIALRRDAATLDYYRAGSTPDAFATLPKEWTADQIRSFQDYFDALMSGNLARRRQTKFMPADFRLIEARQPPLKDQYDEWLARLICYAFSVPVSPFVSQVNRATGETLRQQATQEGLVPLKAWVKNALDHAICVCMNEPALEFVWVGDDAVDPLEQAQTLEILVGAGIKTREEARADLGLAPAGGAPGKASAKLVKYNLHHDERGRFATADNAAGPVGSPTRKPRPTRVQVASNDAMRSDAGGSGVAEIEPPPIEPPPPPEPETPRPEENTPATPTGSSLEDIAAGKFPGVATSLGTPRTMPASDDPASAAQSFIRQLTAGRNFLPIATDLDTQGGYVFQLTDGTYIAYRPPGVSSERTESTIASVDVNSPEIRALNNRQILKLKFPKK